MPNLLLQHQPNEMFGFPNFNTSMQCKISFRIPIHLTLHVHVLIFTESFTPVSNLKYVWRPDGCTSAKAVKYITLITNTGIHLSSWFNLSWIKPNHILPHSNQDLHCHMIWGITLTRWWKGIGYSSIFNRGIQNMGNTGGRSLPGCEAT